ncbi:MAG: hypothetical protein NC820_05155 [Candidatus Omnitrophica bacterium]|nr:hypothetical protein [Candidatus Omnitrophota bacterium]
MINPKISLAGRAIGILAGIIFVGILYILSIFFGEKGVWIFLSVLFGMVGLFFVYLVIKLIIRLWRQS